MINKSFLLTILGLAAVATAFYVYTNFEESAESIDSTPQLETRAPKGQLADANKGMQPTAISDEVYQTQHIANPDRDLEPLDVRTFRDVRGYYIEDTGVGGANHPYEHYDLDTLQRLVDQDDGTAQMVLADRINATDPDRADDLYLRSAVNGKTAGLVNLASNRLIVVPGGAGFGFPFATESGEISDDFAEILKFYAAAELLGDFIGTEMLQAHIESSGVGRNPANLKHICDLGLEIADLVKLERKRKWGESSKFDTPVNSVDVPQPLCNK